MRTPETSAKFRLDGVRAGLADAGFDVCEQWVDDADDSTLPLARRA